MPCTLSNARARHLPVNACPAPNLCCDDTPSFSSKPVCCGEDGNFDSEWRSYDLAIGVFPGTGSPDADPTYTQDAETSYALYKVSGKSLFVKFSLALTVTGAGSGIYCFSLPPGINIPNSNKDVGIVFLDIANSPNLPPFINLAGHINVFNGYMKLYLPDGTGTTAFSFVLSSLGSPSWPLVNGRYDGDIHIHLE